MMNKYLNSMISTPLGREACLETLEHVGAGNSAIVKSVIAKGPMRRRLFDLGFVEGAKVDCIMKSPLGDPTAYFIRGTLVALRREDSANILVIK